ncbi:AraC family transcriptional regulator [Cupriavidus sp. USMAHM13]|uniref:AraC family transcriptional regulator n=1 Tax=Cupriavidus sp. USMAHM13 TaxID=1389192 RepID=UPI0008A6F1BE|nr:helix-turn-helix transcriptional regulator [Cupriavidus sp. USMAHM13]AOY99608.1 AraC family transcriptional regulator [Cupriavidus sp. USMAHM13]
MTAAAPNLAAVSFDPALYDAAPSPLTGVAADYPAGAETPFHRHARCQLVYAVEGVMVVEAATGRWVVPPTTAVWLGPDVEHRLLMRGPVRVRSVFVAADAAGGLPAAECVIHVSPLLRELISEIAHLGLEVCATRRGRLVAALLREELRRPQALPFHLPWPADARIAAICAELSGNPAHPFHAADWAASLAMSEKTFHRHFHKHTGLSFGRWRQQARLLLALDHLLRGEPILPVALRCGYESHSAFTLAFRKQFGMPPSRFLPAG